MSNPADIATLPDASPLDAGPGPLYGLWPGVVVDDKDPDKDARVKVRVHQAYGDEAEDEFIADEMLPWALPCLPHRRAIHIPEVGDGVWVQFWMGDRRRPVWMGAYFGDGDRPSELESAYKPEPRTRIIKTAGNQTIEMRWVKGEEVILIESSDGTKLEVKAGGTAGDGPSIEATTPDGSFIKLLDSTQANGPKIQLSTPGDFEVTAQGKTTQSYSTASVLTFLASLVVTAVTTLALTATGVLTITGASLVLASVTGLVSLGLAGAKQKIVTENYFTAIQNPNVTAYNAHTHIETGGSTLGPSALMSPAVTGTHSTANTEAN